MDLLKWPILRESDSLKLAGTPARVASPGPFGVGVSQSPPRRARLVKRGIFGLRGGSEKDAWPFKYFDALNFRFATLPEQSRLQHCRSPSVVPLGSF